MEDQPLKGVEKVIWWIEYVIRHKGAEFLKSPAAEMSFVQYFLLDVVIVTLLISSAISYLLRKIFILFRHMIKQKSKKD